MSEETVPVLIVTLDVAGAVSKSRARLGDKGRFYTPQNTRVHERNIQTELKRLLPGFAVDVASAFGIEVEFFRSTKQRRDLDNMIKTVLDACTGFVWGDDSQVTHISASVKFGATSDRTRLLIHRLS